MNRNKSRRPSLCLAAIFALLVSALPAQSPNTGAMIVVVTDQTGAVLKDARITITNNATGAVREAITGSEGSAAIPGLSLTGTYTVKVTKDGFGAEESKHIALRAGETSTVKVKLMVCASTAEVTVYGTVEDIHAKPQIGRSYENAQIEETPILGRKLSSVPLLNSAFRQAKGTGDLFVNQTYVATGAGSRRTLTTTLDGANNDEAWGRQIAMSTLPVGAVEEMSVLTNAFSSEFGWTSGSALNIVTKSGTNDFHGEALYLGRPGDMQAKGFTSKNFCPPSVSSCTAPANLASVSAVDIPDSLKQWSGSLGGHIIKDKTFFFVANDYTQQDRTTLLSNTLPSF